MNKVVIFGIDGGSLKLIEQWKDDLPTLRRIMEEGVYGELESTFPPVTCPAWPCMFTGKNPGKLGIYDFIKYLPAQEKVFKLSSSLDYSSQAIWKILNAYGKKVGLLNLAMTFPTQKIDSFMVSGMGTPDAMKGNYTYPPDLKMILNEVVKGYEVFSMIAPGSPEGREEQYIKAFERTLIKREKAASYLMKHFSWDLFVCVFFVLDTLQHFFWHYMDENHPKHRDSRYQNVIKDFYVKIDSAVNRLLVDIPEGTNILIVSDHGFGPMHGTFVVNRWLENNNFLKLKNKIQREKVNVTLLHVRNFLMARLGPNITRLIARLLPRVITKKLADLKWEKNNMIEVYQNIDWSRTKAYGMGKVGAIYINLKGREPGGIVEPGQEYEEVRDDIIIKLRQIADPKTGKAVDIEIFKKEEVYRGQYFGSAPDIVYRIEKYYQANSVRDRSEWGQSTTSGWHVPEGIFFAYGPDIKQRRDKLAGLKIYDITPTVLHMFGLPIPDDIDGRVLTEIFKPDSDPARKEVTYKAIGERQRVKDKIGRLKGADKI